MRLVQVIASPVNQVSPRMRTTVLNAIPLNQKPPRVKLVLPVASATAPLAPLALRHAGHVQEEHQATALSVLPVSLLITARVSRPTQMAFVRDRVLSLIMINENVMVSHSQVSLLTCI